MKRASFTIIRKIAPYTPASLRATIRSWLPATSYDLFIQEEADPYANEPPVWVGKPGPTLGIIKELTHYHKHYIQACREMGISYQIVDISESNWIETIEKSNCDAYLAWPSSALSIWKDMYDDRLAFMVEHMGKIIYPTQQETWLYENKRRVNYWLEIHKIPHPRTFIFYKQEEAELFINNTEFPMVLKTNTGASASGVFILRKRAEGLKKVRQAFNKGIVARRHHPMDRNWGYILLQEYISIAKEWRMVRMGDSFFGHPKGLNGEFHSGSGVALWDVPSAELLNFVKDITCKGNFTSMDVDIFETREGKYLVNELQTVFGASVSIDQLRVDGKPGRFIWNALQSSWDFETGDFARNACANARVEYVLQKLLPRTN